MKALAAIVGSVLCAMVCLAGLARAEEVAWCGASSAGLDERLRMECERISEAETGTPTFEARIVFISYPDAADSTLVAWADSLPAVFEDFVAAMSRGQRTMHATVLKRPGADSTLAWMASRPSTQYSGYGSANTEVMQNIASEIESAWVGVTTVFAMHYKCHPEPYPCGTWGFNSLRLTGEVPGFAGGGETQHIEGRERYSGHNAWVAMHEFGHLLGFGHTPRTADKPPSPYLNVGRYDLMTQAPSAALVAGGLVPYNPIALSGIGWLPLVVVAKDTMGVEIPDAFDATTSAVYLVVADPQQAFLIANHQMQNVYEARYQGSGLLVWHITLWVTPANFNSWFVPSGAAIWDLEVASGKFTDGEEDPAGGKDALEASSTYLGSSTDFFDADSLFSYETNPNSDLYESTDWEQITTTPQNIPSFVAIGGITKNAETGVITCNIYGLPAQILSPNGGEMWDRGDTTRVVRWNVGYTPCTSADILISRDGGSTFCPLAENQPNTGSYSWHILEAAGSAYRLKVLVQGTGGECGSDESDADFSIVDLRTCQ